MELTELAKMCMENIAWCNKHGITPVLSLSIRAGKNSARKYSKPFGASGPSGKIVEWGAPSGQDICLFNTIDLLAFLVANGVVSVEQAAQHGVQPTASDAEIDAATDEVIRRGDDELKRRGG